MMIMRLITPAPLLVGGAGKRALPVIIKSRIDGTVKPEFKGEEGYMENLTNIFEQKWPDAAAVQPQCIGKGKLPDSGNLRRLIQTPAVT